MDIEYSIKEKIVGTFIILVAVLLFGTVVIIGRGKDWFETYVTYYTTFDESYNLQVNAAVKLFKADIGKVRKITLVENKVRLELAILKNYASRFRTDTVATVESPTFIGSEYVSITPGSPDSPPIPEGGEIKSKAKKSIDDILAEFEVEKTAKKFVAALQDLSDVAEILSQPEGPLFRSLNSLSRTLKHVEDIVEDVNEGEGSLGELLRTQRLSVAVYKQMAQIEIILANIARASEKTIPVMEKLDTNMDVIHSIVQGIDQGVAELRPIIREVDQNVKKVDAILTHIEQGSKDVPEMVRSARAGIQEIRNGVENFDKVFQALQKNFLIKRNIAPEPVGGTVNSGLRR